MNLQYDDNNSVPAFEEDDPDRDIDIHTIMNPHQAVPPSPKNDQVFKCTRYSKYYNTKGQMVLLIDGSNLTAQHLHIDHEVADLVLNIIPSMGPIRKNGRPKQWDMYPQSNPSFMHKLRSIVIAALYYEFSMDAGGVDIKTKVIFNILAVLFDFKLFMYTLGSHQIVYGGCFHRR